MYAILHRLLVQHGICCIHKFFCLLIEEQLSIVEAWATLLVSTWAVKEMLLICLCVHVCSEFVKSDTSWHPSILLILRFDVQLFWELEGSTLNSVNVCVLCMFTSTMCVCVVSCVHAYMCLYVQLYVCLCVLSTHYFMYTCLLPYSRIFLLNGNLVSYLLGPDISHKFLAHLSTRVVISGELICLQAKAFYFAVRITRVYLKNQYPWSFCYPSRPQHLN